MRPVREQLEHDRVIRLLQAKYKRKFEVGINPGNVQAVPVGAATSPWYPDLVLQSLERGRRLLGVVEVETAESVNYLEAMSQWGALARLRVPFHLYVPASNIDTTRRLCADLGIGVEEIWAYATLGDQVRFNLVQRAGGSGDGKVRASGTAVREKAKPVKATKATPVARPAKRAPAAPVAKAQKAAAPRGRVVAKAPARRAAASKPAARAQKRK